MLRIVSLNLNGIRSAWSKGFPDWVATHGADIFCFQELKAQIPDLAPDMIAPPGYHAYYHCAEKRGYSGVGLWSRREPDRVVEGIGHPGFDAEGRYLRADFGKLTVVSLYLPSGSSSEERQQAKFNFMAEFAPVLAELMAEAQRDGREVVVCGDWNIAHKEIDLKNWKSNQKNSGFLPEERAWLSSLFDQGGWVDAFRRVDERPERYTWWSNRGQAWAKNVGWRIDYQIATPGLAAAARHAEIWVDSRFSDHAPLTLDYDIPLA